MFYSRFPERPSRSQRLVVRLATFAALATIAIMATGCGPSAFQIAATTEAQVATAVARVPTATPQPTATPIAFPATPTPIVLPTPAPTPTPIQIPPTATPQPSPTPAPTATPFQPLPTATPQPTATPILFPPSATPLAPPTAVPTPTPSFNDVYLQVAASVVYIETPDGSGTGWAIREGLIATNEHVVGTEALVTLRHLGQDSATGAVVFTDPVRDIAFVSYDAAEFDLEPLPLRSLGVTDVGLPLMVLGYSESGVKPDGTVGSPSAKVGVLSQLVDFGSQGGLRLRVDAVMDPGDSGGPTVDPRGNVVGMNQGTLVTTTSGQRVVGVFFAAHADEISERLTSFLGE